MTPEQLAARVLADCPRFEASAPDGDVMVVPERFALAAIARLFAPGDDLVEDAGKVLDHLEKVDPFDSPYSAADAELDAANTITALLARLSALTAERDAARQHAVEARLREKAAEDARVSAVDEAARLRDRLAQMEGAAKALRDDMLERARTGLDAVHGEEYRIVNAGRTAWADFCAAITESPAQKEELK